MKKHIFLFCFSVLFAFGINSDQKNIYDNIAPSDEMGNYQENIIDPFKSNSELILNAQNYKNEYFVEQVFSIDLTAKTTEDTEFVFKVDVDKNKDLVFLNPKPKWNKNGFEYDTKLYFEAKTPNAILNQISVSLIRNKEAFQESSLVLEKINFKNINADKDYSHIIASNLVVNKVRTNFFDDKNVVMVLELSAQNTNLKNFRLNNAALLQQRVDNVRGDFDNSTASYSVVFNSNINNFNFSYYNTTNEKFENINLKVEIKNNDDISTQTDLNPQNSDLNFYKQIALWTISGLCALIFAFKKSYIFFGIALVTFVLSFLINSDVKKGILKANSNAKLLPTSQSTYFYTNQQNEEVHILGHRDNFTKVLFQDGKIGWVDNENLQKH